MTSASTSSAGRSRHDEGGGDGSESPAASYGGGDRDGRAATSFAAAGAALVSLSLLLCVLSSSVGETPAWLRSSNNDDGVGRVDVQREKRGAIISDGGVHEYHREGASIGIGGKNLYQKQHGVTEQQLGVALMSVSGGEQDSVVSSKHRRLGEHMATKLGVLDNEHPPRLPSPANNYVHSVQRDAFISGSGIYEDQNDAMMGTVKHRGAHLESTGMMGNVGPDRLPSPAHNYVPNERRDDLMSGSGTYEEQVVGISSHRNLKHFAKDIEDSFGSSSETENHLGKSGSEQNGRRRLLRMPTGDGVIEKKIASRPMMMANSANNIVNNNPANNAMMMATSANNMNIANNNPSDNNNDDNFMQPQLQYGQTVSGPGVIINMLRRAKDIVSEKDVPFLLQIPHTSSETIYDIMTQCYGLVGKHYDSTEELERARRLNVVDSYYVSSHERPASMFRNFGERFHFLATPHYQEGAALLTLKHKGRMIVMMRHPAIIAENVYLTMPGTRRGDIAGLMRHVNSTNYYDNWMTRMMANVPKHVEVTEEHFRTARMILENKFLIGMTADMAETVSKRLRLYFGWKETPDRQGCELEHIKRGSMSLPPTSLEEGGREWRIITRINRFDMKLYARGMAVFGDQKMRVPIHPVVREEERAAVTEAFSHLRNKADPRDRTDLPFFWHIPKASGTTVKETLSDCYGLVRTEMIRPPSSLDVIETKKVLNVDLSTPDAVAVARKKRVADRGLADVFVSQLSLEGSTVFTPQHMGRAFTIMRHPVKLAASLFYYRRIATWEPTYRPDYKDMTLQEYVEKDGYYDNWMVRMLTNAKLGGLNEGHLDLAKTILKEKFVIGISDHMDETFKYLELYYGWAEGKEGCVDFHLHSAPSNKNKYPVPERGGAAWSVIADKNKFDMALYYYALEIFGDQSEKLFRAEKEGR